MKIDLEVQNKIIQFLKDWVDNEIHYIISYGDMEYDYEDLHKLKKITEEDYVNIANRIIRETFTTDNSIEVLNDCIDFNDFEDNFEEVLHYGVYDYIE